MSQSNQGNRRINAEGIQVFPYRNTEDEYPSDVREWLDAHVSDNLETVRAENTTRNRAILALARFKAEYTGIRWDSLPWSDEMLSSCCQSWYVMQSKVEVDYMLDIGLLCLPD